jgi:hypothetical protein
MGAVSTAKQMAGLLGAAAAGQSSDAEAGFVTRAGREVLEFFHGSPAKFDKFELPAEVGTSNGQMYGHGVYGSDSIDTAKGYRPRDYDAEEMMMAEYNAAIDAEDYDAAAMWENAMLHITPDELRRDFSSADYPEGLADSVASKIEAQGQKGMLASVEADIDSNSMLDWDLPVSEQPEKVRETLLLFGYDKDQTGAEVYEQLTKDRAGLRSRNIDRVAAKRKEAHERMESLKPDFAIGDDVDLEALINGQPYNGPVPKESDAFKAAEQDYLATFDEMQVFADENTAAGAAKTLDELGVHGIRYPNPDRATNAYGKGPEVEDASNYVVFDPNKMRITQQGNATPGFMALLGAGGAGATAAARGSHPVSQQAGQLWDDLKGTAQGLLDVAEMPARGLQGLGRVGYGMLTGEGFDESMRQGNDVLQGGTEAAAQKAGDEVFKRTGSAEMATAAYTAVMTGSPI